jgi:hypothetical protein
VSACDREKAVIAAHATIERTYGLVLGIKPAATNDVALAINDGLQVISEQRKHCTRVSDISHDAGDVKRVSTTRPHALEEELEAKFS